MMIGIFVGLAIVAAIAAVVITDASPRSPELSTLALWHHPLPGSGNGMQASNGSIEEGLAWSDRSPQGPSDEDPSASLDPSSLVRNVAVPRTGSIDLVPVGAARYVEAPLLQPDPERLIQTEVAIHEDPSVRWLALARLVGGVVGFAAVVAFMMIGFARGVAFLIKKLAGG